MTNFIICCLNCIRCDQNWTFETGLTCQNLRNKFASTRFKSLERLLYVTLVALLRAIRKQNIFSIFNNLMNINILLITNQTWHANFPLQNSLIFWATALTGRSECVQFLYSVQWGRISVSFHWALYRNWTYSWQICIASKVSPTVE
jgi:hypothetical protein